VLDQLAALSRGDEPPPWPTWPADHPVDPAVAAVPQLVAELQDREAGIVSTILSLAQRWQNTAHDIQRLVDTVVAQHPDNPDLLQACNSIRHAAAQQAHRVQSVVILAGGYTGQQWPNPLPLAEVALAAAGRIEDYTRVKVVGGLDMAVDPAIVEELIHIIAAFLVNATRSSSPDTEVVVTTTQVDDGWAIVVTDEGTGLEGTRLTRAQGRVSGRDPVGLHQLGAPPETGLAVIGELTRRPGYGFRTELGSAENGGVRAMTVVPHHLLSPVEHDIALPLTPSQRTPCEPDAPASAPPGLHRRTVPETHISGSLAADEDTSGEYTSGGLPKRTRRPPQPESAAPPVPDPVPLPDPGAVGAALAGFVDSARIPSASVHTEAPVTTKPEEPR
jgi:hypothetical protein